MNALLESYFHNKVIPDSGLCFASDQERNLAEAAFLLEVGSSIVAVATPQHPLPGTCSLYTKTFRDWLAKANPQFSDQLGRFLARHLKALTAQIAHLEARQ